MITGTDRPYWMPKSKFFLQSMTPTFSEEYEADQCWHGCDKVSLLIRKDDIERFVCGGGGS